MVWVLVGGVILFLRSCSVITVCVLTLLLVAARSGVEIRFFITRLSSALPILILVFGVGVFVPLSRDGNMFTVTARDIVIALGPVVRLVFILLWSELFLITTTPLQVTQALEFFLWPFGKLGLPVGDIVTAAVIALRFVPVLLGEYDKLWKAQVARGAPQGGMAALMRLLFPLLVRGMRTAMELAVAMEARAYDPSAGIALRRTIRWKKAEYGLLSVIAITIVILYFLDRQVASLGV